MPANLWASRQKLFRVDYSNEWRYEYGDPQPPDRSVALEKMLPEGGTSNSFRFVILGDTGEAGHCQYGLLPLIKGLKPGFMLINGDVAYPSGRIGTTHDDDDFLAGFFEPYRNMNCAIWATVGNHEYYSPGNGREFYDTFCTRKFDARWECYGLRHETLQPGTSWELDDLNGPSKLVILGLDTGKSANLDGHNDWWQFWKRSIDPDLKQDAWLRSRLDRAENAGGRVIVLFHIPALVREQKVEDYLNMLHRAISGYSCVQVVISAHEHNFQLYSPETFRNYLQTEELAGATLSNPTKPSYIVAGSSGASLEDTSFSGTGKYKSETVYPSAADWKAQATLTEKAMSKLRMNKTMVSDIESRVSDAAFGFGYNNVPMYSTCLLVEVGPDAQGKTGVALTPAFLKDVQDLFSDRPDGTMVDIMSDLPAQKLVDDCLHRELTIRF